MDSLDGKTAFITGGASGLGLSMANSLYEAGMNLVLADVEGARLDEVTSLFDDKTRLLTVEVDVTDRTVLEEAAQRAEESFGNVHVVCNNAGVGCRGSVETLNYNDWDWVLGVNLQGVINGVTTFVNRMLAHGEGGHIVNTSSIAGLVPVPNISIYNTSKYGVLGLSETMHHDLAGSGVGVSVLCPGVISTNLPDSQRNRPADLSSDESKPDSRQSDDRRSPRLQELMSEVIDPAIVGDLVRHAIETDEFYIFTHPAWQEAIDDRMAKIRAACDRWASFIDNWSPR